MKYTFTETKLKLIWVLNNQSIPFIVNHKYEEISIQKPL